MTGKKNIKPLIQRNNTFHTDLSSDNNSASKRFFIELLFVVALVYIVFGIIFNITLVKGESMEPTLKNNSIVLVEAAFSNPEVGDIVVCDPENYGKTLIKRVIAGGGDIVNIDPVNGIVYVNDEPLNEEYIKAPTYAAGDLEYPFLVPEDCFFVMGDNRNRSIDSRTSDIGAIPRSEIRGVVALSR